MGLSKNQNNPVRNVNKYYRVGQLGEGGPFDTVFFNLNLFVVPPSQMIPYPS